MLLRILQQQKISREFPPCSASLGGFKVLSWPLVDYRVNPISCADTSIYQIYKKAARVVVVFISQPQQQTELIPHQSSHKWKIISSWKRSSYSTTSWSKQKLPHRHVFGNQLRPTEWICWLHQEATAISSTKKSKHDCQCYCICTRSSRWIEAFVI